MRTMSKALERVLPLFLSFVFIFTTNAKAQRAIVTGERYASVTLQSTPAGAKVYLNNKLICASTPATVQIPYKGIIMPGKKKDAAERMRRSAEASKITLLFQMDGCTAGEEILTPTITEVKKRLCVHMATHSDTRVPRSQSKERCRHTTWRGTQDRVT